MELLITVRVKPKSKKEYIKRIDENNFIIAVHEPPEKGRANKRVMEMLAEYLNISKNNITLLKGEKSKTKIFKIKFPNL